MMSKHQEAIFRSRARAAALAARHNTFGNGISIEKAKTDDREWAKFFMWIQKHCPFEFHARVNRQYDLYTLWCEERDEVIRDIRPDIVNQSTPPPEVKQLRLFD